MCGTPTNPYQVCSATSPHSDTSYHIPSSSHCGTMWCHAELPKWTRSLDNSWSKSPGRSLASLKSRVGKGQSHSKPIDVINYNHIITILLPYYYHITTILLPYYYHIITILLPYYYHITTILLPYSYPIITILLPYYYHIITILLPYFYHIITILLPYYYHIITILLPYYYHILTILLPYYYNIISILLPYYYLILTLLLPYDYHIIIILLPYYYHIITIFRGNHHPALPTMIVLTHRCLTSAFTKARLVFGKSDGHLIQQGFAVILPLWKKGSPHNFFLEISREIHAILLPSKFEELAHTICGECARSKIH